MEKNYIDERKKEIEADFQSLQNKSFTKIIQLVDEFKQEAGLLQKKFQDILEKEKIAKQEEGKEQSKGDNKK
jgi:hypothetical protein